MLSSSIPVVPRARTCVLRGLWGTLPPNERNMAARNPHVWESDCPVFTTDARMDKAAEILDTAAAPVAAIVGLGPASGGGGPVEAVWWCADAGTQWRVRGTAWVLGPDVEGEGGEMARDVLMGRMRKVTDGTPTKERSWSWRTEVTGHFGNLSPGMRGSFRNPPPGTPVAIPPSDGEGLGQKVEDLEDELARTHFRVVVIVPTEVDQADLSDSAHPRRWIYTYRGDSYQSTQPGGEVIGEWEKVEVWP
jgi:pyridoxamine 5'-phosphate oxidase